MAIITRPRFKISQDPNSNKVQGLRVGDLALRQYFDNTTQFYSLLLVDEIGGTQATGNYFVGQLIDGDEPGATGVELLDFVRVTNIIDEERMGAVYISGTGSDAPRIDALADGGKEASICWPTFLGAGGYEALNHTGTFGSGVVLDEPAINSKRAFKITRNSTPAAEAWYLRSSISLSKTNAGMIVDKQYVVSYRYRASKPMSISHSISDSDGTNSNGSWVDQFSTDWKYNAITFSCIFSTSGTQFHASLASVLSSGDWVEYADFTVVPLDSLKIIRSSVKSCVGNMNGIVDPVFGKLKDYGGYFQRLYATKDVNIAGTLTAGDENGFGTTFYAGKIAKNLITNSDLRPENTGISMNVGVEQMSLPNGTVGGARKITSTGAASQYYLGGKAGLAQNENITFSVFVRSTDAASIRIGISDYENGAGGIFKSEPVSPKWSRISISQNTSRIPTRSISFSLEPVGASSGQSWYLWGFQVEYGKAPTPYQPTDGTLSSSTDYGMWANRGGFGGTIQNPILKLQPDGTIVGGNNKLILRPDGSAEFNGTVVISGSGGQPLDVEQAINQAKSEAISTSSTDATTKANQAKIDAEAAAALDAAQKATQAKNDAISSAATDATNKAGTAKSEAISAASQDATTKANGAVTTALANTVTEIGKIVNGDRNLLLDSGVEFGAMHYQLGVKQYSPFERRKGKQYTITMCYTLGDNNSNITAYEVSGSYGAASFSTRGSRVIESKTFTPAHPDWGIGFQSMGFYQFPNGQFGSKIHWVIVVEGNKSPTTFIPAPEDIDSNINTQFNASKQFATDSITDLKNNYLGDLALLDTLDGGKITDGTIDFAKLGSTIISGGYIKTELLDANAIRTNIINVNYIEGLSLNFVRGMIGGWVIGDNTISSGGVAISSTLRSMFVTKPSGGHSTVGQTYVGGAWTGKYGFASTNASGQVLFRADEAANIIGGWNFDTSKLYSGAIELGASGYIRNTSDKWRLNNDGSGQLAAGNIGWDAAGNVTFGANVQLNWKSYTDSAVGGVVVGGRNYYKKNTPYDSQGTAAVFNRNRSINGFQLTGAADMNNSRIRLLQLITSNGDWTVSFEFAGNQGVPVAFTMEVSDLAAKRFNNPSTTDAWLRVEYTVNVTNYTSDVYNFIDFEYITHNYINFRNFKVERGNKATDWTPAPEDDDYLKTHIDSNGIYTGTLTTQQLNAAQATVLGNVTAGSFNIGSGKFSVASDGTLNANGVNISGTLNSTAGNIGGWQINSDEISKGAVNINAGLQTIFVSKPGGGHVMLGQTYVNGGYTGNYGFSSTDPSNRPLIRMDGSINYIAGWQFDYSRIYSGTMELGSAGYIRNTADKWRLNQDGSGSFASGKLSFDAAGNTQIAGWRVATDLLASDSDRTILRKDGSFKLASGQVVGDVAGNVTLGANVKLAWGTDPKNLLDWSGWTLGSDPVPNFSAQGSATENKREMNYGPNDKYSMMWVCTSDGLNDVSGGWFSGAIAVDNRYPYRYCCWVYNEVSSGSRYHGCLGVSNLTGSESESPNDNPYFYDSLAVSDGEWYLMVGYIHPAGYQGSYIGVSGLYDSTGAKVANGTEYKLLNSSTSVRFRTYYFYATIAGARQLLYAPCVHKIDGTEPSLSQIIGNRVVTTHIDANGIYTGTLTATQVNAVEINASSIKTGNLTVGGTNAGGIGSVRVLDAANSELVTLGINGITATKGVIGGMTIAGNKLSGSSIDIQNEATIGGFKVTSYGLRNTVNQDAYIYIANTSGSGSSTVKRTAALGNAVSSTVGFDVASLFGASGPGENRAIVVSATGSSSNWNIFGGKANIAIEAVGGISWKLNTGDHWCMPGLLKITEFNVTNSSISIARDWGNGFIMSKVQRIEHGLYRIVHDIGHTDYSVSIIAHEQNTDGNWWCSIPSIINKGIYQVEFSFRNDGGNRQNPSWFQVSFFGQQGNLAT